MRTQLKPFQEETVEVILNAFRSGEKVRRFLLADEVGLGKTIVARQVIHRMMRRFRRPLIVFYVCSSLSIGWQNQRNLLKLLPEEEREIARCEVDRLTLMLSSNQPTHKHLHLYTLTPNTSIPARKGQHRGGRKEERALVQVLVETLWPRFLPSVGTDFFRVNVRTAKSWQDAVDSQRKHAGNRHLLRSFEKSVRLEFAVEQRRRTDTTLKGHLRRHKDNLEIIKHLRNALAACAIQEIHPDLVIFDEFQRFRDLLAVKLDDAAARVIRRLRGDIDVGGRTPSLLLMSATPYRHYLQRWEDVSGRSHQNEFFELVKFLYGNDDWAEKQKKLCQEAFGLLAYEIVKGRPLSDKAAEARKTVESVLQPIMARTERASHDDGWADNEPGEIPATLDGADLKVYRHLSQSLVQRHRSSSVIYWNSIPLPMQTMGTRYEVWKQAIPADARGVPGLSAGRRNRFQRPKAWPHPRLRAVIDEFLELDQLALPWIPPSLPWWRLGGKWRNSNLSKSLVFSRFRAVPQSIASLVSYELETRLFEGQTSLSYTEITRRRLLNPTPKRHALLGLFCPSPWLIGTTDPLKDGRAGVRTTRKKLQQQIRRSLRNLKVSVKRSSRGKKPFWQLLAQIEIRAGNWDWVIEAWWQIHYAVGKGSGHDTGLAGLLRDWSNRAKEPLDYITHDELDELTDYALGGPGIVLGRALKRFWPDALIPESQEKKGFTTTLDTVWNGLRNYLDQRWFVAALRGGSGYPRAIRKAVIDGNLEAVLDEHFWISRTLSSLEGAELAIGLRDAFHLRSSVFRLHALGQRRHETFSLRCHVAIPFTDPQMLYYGGEGRPLRQDEIRKSFNTPFWPHVLATTSVGQEGLDFHVWCDRLVHWDLSRNPVDWEQREGRIQRYGGLSIRRAIAKQLGKDLWKELKRGQSPWEQLASLADDRLGDESGLEPWWVCNGAFIGRFVVDVPLSEQDHQLAWIREQRLLYRMVLGLPHQEDVVQVLSDRTDINPEQLREAMLQLSPWFGKRGKKQE